MSTEPDDQVDTDPDFTTTPDGQAVDPGDPDAHAAVPTEKDED